MGAVEALLCLRIAVAALCWQPGEAAAGWPWPRCLRAAGTGAGALLGPLPRDLGHAGPVVVRLLGGDPQRGELARRLLCSPQVGAPPASPRGTPGPCCHLALPVGQGQPGVGGGCSWFSATPRSQPPACVCLSSSSASPGSTLGAHRARLCRACGETEARGMAWRTRGRARIQVLRPQGRAVPPIHVGRGPMPAPFPVSGCVPVPAAGQLGCPRTQLGCTALPGSCRAP